MSAVQPAAVRRSGRMKKEMYRCRYLYILIALPVIYFIIFKYVPMYGVMIAFENFKIRKGIWGSEWVGLAHFAKYLFLGTGTQYSAAKCMADFDRFSHADPFCSAG